MTGQTILEIKNINKSFGPAYANRDICLTLKKGEIRGFAGENGSGKSTLSSMICGMQQPDSGEMFLNGKKYAPKTPQEANAAKVAMVVQELGVVGNLPVYMNMFLGKMEPFQKGGIVQLKKMEREAAKQLEKWGFSNIPLKCNAHQLSIEQRKIIELVRALSSEPELLVLDEITQALSHDNRQKLYKIMKDFVGAGNTIFMITHDIEEMIELSDNITVLRDGQVVKTVACTPDFTSDALKKMMIGREINSQYYCRSEESRYQKDVIMKVENLNVSGKLKNISFDLHAGEILGVCGLSDAGIHTLGKAIFRLEEHTTGKITVKGEEIKKSGDIVRTRGAFLSKDRDDDGLMLSANIRENIFLPSAKNMSGKLGFISPKKVTALAQGASDKFEIKSSGLDHIVRRLSGGNKQKVNLSRWLVKDLDYIILDCPTRGVDIGVKAYIYEVMNKAKESGMAILLISDELTEAIGMSDNIMVMKNGEVVRTLNRDEGFSEEAIIEVML